MKRTTKVVWVDASKAEPPKEEETINGPHTMGAFKVGKDVGPMLAFNGVTVFPAYWRKNRDEGWCFVQPEVDDYLPDVIPHVTHWAYLPEGPK